MEPSSVYSQLRTTLSREVYSGLSEDHLSNTTRVRCWRGIRNRVNNSVSAMDLGVYVVIGREVDS